MLFQDVKYFDNNPTSRPKIDHKTKILASPFGKVLDKLVSTGFLCIADEYLAYSCFTDQFNGTGVRTYANLQTSLFDARLASHEVYFDFTGRTLIAKFSTPKDTRPSIIEEAGVGMSLALMSQACQVTQADWTRIPTAKKRTLDFNLAVSPMGPVIVESKGTITGTPNSTAGLSEKEKEISEKKQNPSNPSNVPMYGVITAITSDPNLNTTCYLLDPEIEIAPQDWQKVKLLARLRYYTNLFASTYDSHILSSAYTRLRAIELSADYRSLSNLPLLNRRGRSYDYPKAIMKLRSITEDEQAVGEVFKVGHGKYFFLGMDFSLIELILKPDFEQVNNISFVDRYDFTQKRKIKVRIPDWQLPDTQRSNDKQHRMNRVEVAMEGVVTVTPSGLSLGFLSLP